ncbi:uncharacterized protein [Clinocottus analis]|uniref:uncharacterized protein isoform X2 n=1 Tax=Clinocottus analis TaxID=304258 RepID=UPI0035C2396F
MWLPEEETHTSSSHQDHLFKLYYKRLRRRQRSPEFRLPDISLSSLNALLQTVTQKLRRKRSGGDEGSCRRFQSNRLLEAVSGQRLREKSDIDAVASLGGCRGNTQRIVPSPSSAPKPILTMTKQNLLTSNTSQ